MTFKKRFVNPKADDVILWQVPRRKMAVSNYEDEMDAVNVSKVTDPDILLFQDPIDSNISGKEIII